MYGLFYADFFALDCLFRMKPFLQDLHLESLKERKYLVFCGREKRLFSFTCRNDLEGHQEGQEREGRRSFDSPRLAGE